MKESNRRCPHLINKNQKKAARPSFVRKILSALFTCLETSFSETDKRSAISLWDKCSLRLISKILRILGEAPIYPCRWTHVQTSIRYHKMLRQRPRSHLIQHDPPPIRKRHHRLIRTRPDRLHPRHFPLHPIRHPKMNSQSHQHPDHRRSRHQAPTHPQHPPSFPGSSLNTCLPTTSTLRGEISTTSRSLYSKYQATSKARSSSEQRPSRYFLNSNCSSSFSIFQNKTANAIKGRVEKKNMKVMNKHFWE